jgi:hypothetical protein
MAEPASPGMIAALAAAMRRWVSPGGVDENAAAARAASQQAAQRLPAAVMPHEALRRQREREAQMDALARGG